MLRKHEEEVVLVKSDQKRKITGLQDVINRLRQKVAECHKNIEKDERALQAQNADLRQVRMGPQLREGFLATSVTNLMLINSITIGKYPSIRKRHFNKLYSVQIHITHKFQKADTEAGRGAQVELGTLGAQEAADNRDGAGRD